MRLLKDRRTILAKLRRGIRNVPEMDRQAAKFEKLLRELTRRRKAHAADGFGTMLEHADHMQVDHEKTQLKNELTLKTLEVADLKKRLDDTQTELNGIRRSLGFKFIRFYGRKIDRLFPDTSYCGKIKLAVKERLGTRDRTPPVEQITEKAS